MTFIVKNANINLKPMKNDRIMIKKKFFIIWDSGYWQMDQTLESKKLKN